MGRMAHGDAANPTFSEIWETARGLQETVVAIEACWDGESAGWLVALLAIVSGPSTGHAQYGERNLGLFRDPQGDMRLFNGTAPPWSESLLATECGQQLAELLGVPFHFESPEQPVLDAPRWWDTVT